ncbi:MAG: NAD-dependent epimerase/dehydratase family protein [Candidatus Altiarchaeales archaeon]|nr:NAD-dependent epimerase/dehydratase family protein [Candidatus Altiarchaeales archaeon]
MRVLVTGGAGFLGSHLCERLVEEGDEIICMDNLITSDLSNVSSVKDEGKFTFIKHDVSEKIKIEGDLDFVLHFASPASPVDYLNHPIKTLKVGSLGTHNTLGLAKAKDAKYLLASTSEVYGDPLKHPQKESYWGNVNPVGPRCVYDESKRFAEALTMAYHRKHGLDTRIVRIFNTYGPRMRKGDGRVIPNFINQALSNQQLTVYGDGSQTRSFNYVDDEVEGFLSLMKTDYPLPLNIGNPVEKTILELAEIIIELTDSESKIGYEKLPEDDPKTRCPDISLAEETLGWRPKTDLREGLVKTIDYFKGRLDSK